ALDAGVPGRGAGDRERSVSDLARADPHRNRVIATVMEVARVARQNVAPIAGSGRCRSQTRGRLTMSTADVRGRFIWHELLTTDTAGAAAFYPRVVPWRTQPSSMPGYTLWMAGQTQIGGLTALPQEAGGPPPHWLIYVGTPSVDASCLQAQSLGAKVLKAPADIPKDRKSTRLNSSHLVISYAVFCLKKKKTNKPYSDLRDADGCLPSLGPVIASAPEPQDLAQAVVFNLLQVANDQ